MVVNNDRRAFNFAQYALHRVQAVAVLDRYAFGQAFDTIVFLGFVGHHHNALCTFGAHALRDLDHAMALGALADLLAARHRHCVVVQNFVSDIHTRSNRLAHRQQAAVKVGAIAQVGKNMRVVHKRLLPHPGHAFAAHLGKAGGGAVHPQGHKVAADTGHGARAFWHAGGGVVRAARAKPGLALGQRRAQGQRLHGLFFGVQNRQLRIHAGAHIGIYTQRSEALGNRAGNHGGRQVRVGAQQAVGRRF